MNRFTWIFCCAVAVAAAVKAQTNSPPPAPPTATRNERASTNSAPTTTEILSDQLEWNMKADVQIRRGNVRVSNPQYHMLCDMLTAEMPRLAEDKFQRGIAEGNVIIDWLNDKGETNHATSDKAVYTYSVTNAVTNAWVVLTGHAQVTMPGGSWLRGEPIKWDRIQDKLYATNEQTVIKQTGTNSPTFFEGMTSTKTNSAKPKLPPATP